MRRDVVGLGADELTARHAGHPSERDAIDRPDDPARRRLLVSGTLVVGFTLLPALPVLAQHEAVMPAGSTPPLPGSLRTTPMLDAWIRVDPQGGVTVCTGKAELGTGVRTAFIQIAADELRIPPARIVLVTADTGATPNEGYTAGSHSMADSGTAIQNAAAQVRALLVEAAAARLGVDASTLTVRDGTLTATDGRSMTFGEAVRGLDLHRPAQPASPLTPQQLHTSIGHPLPRVDIPAKVTGGAAYVQDLRLPGMVHARVVRPPCYGATLTSVDTATVEAMPGVLKVVRDSSYLAVVADDEWRAIQAMVALAASASWRDGPPLPDERDVHRALMALPSRRIDVASRRAANPADAAGAAPTRTLTARFTRPYLVHGSIGPSCALAQLKDDGTMTVWTHTQGVYPLRNGLAEMLGMPPERVRCIHVEGAGCYGHNGADDAAADAALIARAVPGRPVRVQWMREQEHTWEPYGPAMTVDLAASLDASGRVVSWRGELWSNSHNQRIENAGRLMPTWFLAQPFVPAPPKPIPMPEGGGDRNSVPLYEFGTLEVVHHFTPEMPVRVSAMRSLGAHVNIFAIESFMDELAAAAGADPVEFRLRHLSDPRARAVVELAARRFDWSARRTRRVPRHGIGFAFAQYKNLMAYVAIALEVSWERETGDVRVERAVAVVDCGQIVNPDGVRNQIEGGIVQSGSWTLHEALRFDRRRITSYDWSTYPVVRFSSVPRAIEVGLIDRPGAPFLGTGEAAQGPTAAALANAIADASGRRVRDMPLAGNRLREGAGA